MLAFMGFAMVLSFMTLIMCKRLSPILALILIPIGFAVLAGFGESLGSMALEGLRNLAPIGVMLMFAILFFGVMIDAGLFTPIVQCVLRFAKDDPMRISLATAALALFISLDGDGSTTYMIATAALLPLYRRTSMNPLIITCLLTLSSAVMNLPPWGGPTARVATVLQVPPSEVFLPLIPAMLLCVAWVFLVAYRFGRNERKRLGIVKLGSLGSLREKEDEEPVNAHQRRMWPINALITALLMLALIMNILPLAVVFMLGFAVALVVNYPHPEEQRERMVAHAASALPVLAMISAAGIFTGILSGTGMVDAMANTVITWLPTSLSSCLPVMIALLSIPLTFFLSNDAFYFGMLPVLVAAAHSYGFSAVEIGRASLVGQQVHLLSPLVPSTFLLVGLAQVELGDHQRFTLPWALGSALLMLLGAIVSGAIPLW